MKLGKAFIMDINSIYKMKFGGKTFNERELYNSIIVEFNQNKLEYKLYEKEKVLYKIKKEASQYIIEFSDKNILYLEKKKLIFQLKEKYSFMIYIVMKI